MLNQDRIAYVSIKKIIIKQLLKKVEQTLVIVIVIRHIAIDMLLKKKDQ